WCFRDREEILDMLEELCGSRMNFNYYRPGGVLYDFPPGWVSKLSRFLDRYEKNIENDYVTILDQNEIFLDRTVGVGTIPSDLAKAYGLTGPMLRGSGVDWDLRRDRPYSIYPELTSLKPVVYTEGDAYARYRVRLGEMRLAIALIRECLDKLPGLGRLGRHPSARGPSVEWPAAITPRALSKCLELSPACSGLCSTSSIRSPSLGNIRMRSAISRNGLGGSSLFCSSLKQASSS